MAKEGGQEIFLSGIGETPGVKSQFFGCTYDAGVADFTILPFDDVRHLLNQISVTSVGALVREGDNFILIRNQRGWDIPGGHLEDGESLLEALKREVKEETGSQVVAHHPVFVLCSDRYEAPSYIPVFMVEVSDVVSDYRFGKEVSEIKKVNSAEFMSIYHGNRVFSAALLEVASKME